MMRLLLGGLVAAAVITGAEAAIDRKAVESAVAEAQALARAGNLAAADSLLRDTLTQCPAGAAGLKCRPLLHYTQGYLHEQAARRDPDARDQLLESAADWYGRVLAEVPDHAKTQANLANVARAQGDPEAAIAWLQRAMRGDPERRDDYILAIGDLYREQEDWPAALAAFERAARWNPDSEAPRLELVETYARLPAGRLEALITRLPDWRDSHPEAAAEGYRLALEAALANGQEAAAERHLLDLVSLLAGQDRLTPARIETLQRLWPGQPLTELQDYLRDPSFIPDWWRQRLERGHTIALVALAAGRQDLARLGPDAVEARWRRAIERLAPRSRHYLQGPLRDRQNARFELQTELAALYHQYPELDDGGEFRELIWGFFRSKARAYEINDQAAIQRHHAILGEIYVQNPELENPDFYAMNAAFQLHHAIKAADTQHSQGQPYQPLARQKQLLAETCAAPSPTVVREGAQYCEGDNAADRRFLDAAKAYLDSDQLDRAGQMLERAEEAGLSRDATPTHRALLRVLRTRAAIDDLSEDSLAESTAVPWDGSRPGSWLAAPAPDHLPADFARRQQFKALADYAAKAEPLAERNAAAATRLEQVRPLLDDAAKGVVLAGTGDQLRVTAVEGLGVRTVSAADCPAPAGQSLKWVQRGLNSLTGRGLDVDGLDGPNTRRAIRDFQTSHGLTGTGRPDRRTKAKLRELLCAP